jgi:hypothetical protein
LKSNFPSCAKLFIGLLLQFYYYYYYYYLSKLLTIKLPQLVKKHCAKLGQLVDYSMASSRRVISTTFVAFGAKEKVANNGLFGQVHTPRACPSHAYLSRIRYYLYSPPPIQNWMTFAHVGPHNFL